MIGGSIGGSPGASTPPVSHPQTWTSAQGPRRAGPARTASTSRGALSAAAPPATGTGTPSVWVSAGVLGGVGGLGGLWGGFGGAMMHCGGVWGEYGGDLGWGYGVKGAVGIYGVVWSSGVFMGWFWLFLAQMRMSASSAGASTAAPTPLEPSPVAATPGSASAPMAAPASVRAPPRPPGPPRDTPRCVWGRLSPTLIRPWRVGGR